MQLLLSSGLRRQEGGSLLIFELPTERLRLGRYCYGTVAAAVTRSNRSRVFYASVEAVAQVEAYVESERAWAVQRAQADAHTELGADLVCGSHADTQRWITSEHLLPGTE